MVMCIIGYASSLITASGNNRQLDDMCSGARVEVDVHKEDPLDFVLWKAAKPGRSTLAPSFLATAVLGGTLNVLQCRHAA